MSLINQVLQDVEKRQAGDASGHWAGQVRPVLQPAAAEAGQRGLKILKWLVLLLASMYLVTQTLRSPVVRDWFAHDWHLNATSAPAVSQASHNQPAGVVPHSAHIPVANPASGSSVQPVGQGWDGLARTLSAHWQSEAAPAVVRTAKIEGSQVPALIKVAEDRREVMPVAAREIKAVTTDAESVTLKADIPLPFTKEKSPAVLAATTASSAEKGMVNKHVKPDQEVNLLIQRAVDQEQKGRSSEALLLLRQAVASYPQSEDARQLLASYLLEAKQDAEAIALLRAGIKSYPEQWMLRKSLAKWQLSHGQPEGVLDSLKPMQASPSQDAELNWMLAMAYQQTGQHTQALPYFERAMNLQPGHAQWYVAYALSLQAAGLSSQALQQLQMAQSLPLSERMSEFVNQQIRQLSGGRIDPQ